MQQPLIIVPITHQSPEKRKENWDRAWKEYNGDCMPCQSKKMETNEIIVCFIFLTLFFISLFLVLSSSNSNNKDYEQ